MSAESLMRRKEFLVKCAGAAAGMGLGFGASCSGGSDTAGNTQGAAKAAAAPVTGGKPTFRKLGAPGIEVTEVGYGASRTMDPTLLNYAFEKGINFFDTGRSYYNGQNEVMVGKVFKGRRQDVVINSKIRPGSLDKMRSDLEESLRALQTDYIDSLLIHDAAKPEDIYGEQAVEFLETAREQGKIRTFGFSAHAPAYELLDLVVEKGLHEVAMVHYNFLGAFTHMLGGHKAEWDAPLLEEKIEAVGDNGMSIIAMKTCSGGYMKDEQGNESYPAALRWVLRNPVVKTTATAMGNFQQIDQNLSAMGAGEAMIEQDERLLLAYAAAWGSEFCRMCGTCRGQCPSGVNVAEVNRLQMYAESYGGDMAREARSTYAALGAANASACEACDSCSVQCPWNVALSAKMGRAHSLLA